MDVCEAVDRFARDVAFGQDEVLESGVLGEIVGRPDGVDGVFLSRSMYCFLVLSVSVFALLPVVMIPPID